MPTYIDIHDAPGVSPDDVARAHQRDLEVQGKHGVNYYKYWVNKEKGKIFCLCTAPNAEAADLVHKEAQRLAARRIMKVTANVAEAFMGAAKIDRSGAVVLPGGVDHDSGTRTILFTDMVGSTDMTQNLGDEMAMTLLEIHDRIVRAALSANGGREVKHTGDGIMAVFLSAVAALRAAMSIQQELNRHGAEHPDKPVQVRIGVASGEPIEHHNDLFGTAVQLAARLCAHAEPNQILASNAVAELCLGKTLPLREVGPVSLKGFSHPVHVHCITCTVA